MKTDNPFMGIDHEVYVVSELGPAIEFWQAKLGLELKHRVTSEEHKIDQAFFPLPDGTFIELLAPTDPSSAIVRIIEQHGEGLYLLAMKVKDLESATKTLLSNGAVVRGSGTDRVIVESELPGVPLIQLWPEDRPHRWRDGNQGN